MRFICMLLGFLTGRSQVKCDECIHLDGQNKCYGHQMPEDVIHKTIACGFYSPKKA
ncbi:MAG: hypothetical protein HY926_06135 [Elusimicrobia bacterium]|nr:hypothetical protein [Elusimicrobiota bacterium]